MTAGAHIFHLAVIAAALSLAALYWPAGRRLAAALAAAAAALGLAYTAWRYYLAWPMTPMYLGTAALPPALIIGGWLSTRAAPAAPQLMVQRLSMALALIIGLACALFPKDFYLPFLKTCSIFSHLHLWFTVLAKAALLICGFWAVVLLRFGLSAGQSRCQSWLMWGFALWTLCLFAGEVWSYLGWGVPVVWDDAVIVCFMATWFYYIGLLHLHLLRSLNHRRRALAAVLGAALVLLLNCYPDLGPYRPLVP